MRRTIIVLSAVALSLGVTATSALADHSREHRIEQAQADLASAQAALTVAQQAVADLQASLPGLETAAADAAYAISQPDATFRFWHQNNGIAWGFADDACAGDAACLAGNEAVFGPYGTLHMNILNTPRATRVANDAAAKAALAQARADLAAAQTALTAAQAALAVAQTALAEAQAAVPLPREGDVIDSDGFAVDGIAVPPTFAPAADVVVSDCTDDGVAFTVVLDNTHSTDGTNAGAGPGTFTTTTGASSTTADLTAGAESTSDERLVEYGDVVAVRVEATVDGTVQTLTERTVDPSNDCDSAIGITVSGPSELQVGQSGVYTVNTTNTRGHHDTLVQVGLEVEALESALESGDVTLEECTTAACDTATPVEFEVTDGILHVTQGGLALDHGADVDRFLRLTFARTGAYVGTVYALDSGEAA
jgi:type II secretory pathway pseudopilin PulG